MMKAVRLIARAGFVALLWMAVPMLHAQGDRGALKGRVTDAGGAVVPGATVTVTEESTKVTLATTSNSDGDYAVPPLNAGLYTVTVTAPGFEGYTKQHVVVDVGVTSNVDVPLAVGATTSEVTVEADAAVVDSSNANLGMTIEKKSITDLPLIYGNPFALEFLTPGISISGVNPNIHVYDSSTATVSVNGSALNSLDYKLDGAPDNRIRYSAFTPSTEFIAQYRVATASYDATQGHSSGGFVNTQLKSGTNQLHGSVFGYYQDPKINANTWQPVPDSSKTNTKPTFVREGFGVGGPILKDKLFFFAGFEHSRQATPNIQTLSVPTAAERMGDFSALLALDTTNGAVTCGATPTVLTGTINKYQLFNPLSASGTAGTRTCVPGNKLTAVSPIAQALFQYYPLPNLATNTVDQKNFYYSQAEPDVYNAEVLRMDYALSERQNMYGHLIRSSRQQKKNEYFGAVSGTSLDYENRGAAMGYTNALSASTALSAVLTYTRFTTFSAPLDQGSVLPTSIGLPSYTVAGLPAFAQSLPRVDLTGYTSASTATGVQSEDDIYLGNISLSQQIGKHFLRYGMEYRRYLTNGESGSGEQGAYVSDGSQLTQTFNTKNSVGGQGYSIAMLEDGLLASGTQTQNSDFAVRSDYYAGFLQDDWRVTPSLTVNMGLRYEYETPDTERNDKEAAAFSFTAANTATPGAAVYAAAGTASKSPLLPATLNPVGGFIFAGTDGYGKQPYNAPHNDFSPRLGFAYSADSKTVLRGGFGIFFDSLNSFLLSGGNFGSTTTFLVPQQGFSQVTTAVTPSYSTTTGLTVASLANPFPAGLTPITGNTLGTSTSLGQNVQFLTPNPHTPYNERWSIGIQRQIGSFIASIDYVGNHGVHLPAGQYSSTTNTGGREYNPTPRAYLSNVQGAYDYANNATLTTTYANPFVNLIPKGASNNLSSSTVALAQLVRPYPEFGTIDAYTFDGMSIYHALQAQIQRRYANGLSMTGAFTWSRTLDATQFLNTVDPAPWYGTSTVDRPLRFATSAIYELPWGHGRKYLSDSRGVVAQIVGGWQAEGVYQIQSGAPLEFDRNDIYYGTGSPGDSHWSRSAYKNSIGKATTANEGYWFDPSNWLQASSNTAAKYPAITCTAPSGTTKASSNYNNGICTQAFPGTYQIRTFGLRYNNLRADRLNQMDVGIQRQFQIRRYGSLQFRAEAINVLNHPVYAAPSTDPTASAFAEIVSQANQPRVYQFSGFFRF
jgi:hypothetical protein